MSTYMRWTQHPKTGHWHHAIWHDDYFGHHNYGVEFNDGDVIDVRQVDLKTIDHEPDNTEIIDRTKDLKAQLFGNHTKTLTYDIAEVHKSMGEAQVDVLNWLIGRCEDQFVRAWIVSERDLVKKIGPISEKGVAL